ncbi:MAG: hypothetical protein OEM77_04085 [Nitrosopumilus sp.]|nr:hypothetical protein [Nitrosopumilus sp.]MDH3735586.1 hypothetical protein [Nitrosopumilus sp.]MDH3822479.1 hypothetical protein [Nitrosopumilus sp.]MDH3832769.1 hypothetical protein [Nitrosopumilus sp.]
MPEVLIENLTFPPEEIHMIALEEVNNLITISLFDSTLRKNKQYDKWINLCGTYDKQIVEQVSIGKNHYENKKFLFTCDLTPGIPDKTASHIRIKLKLIPEE